MNDNAKTIAAALAGLAIGAIIGVFFAPERGSVTRNKLNGGFRRLRTVPEVHEEEMEHHSGFENEGARNARLKKPAREKFKETKEKITGNGSHGPHTANNVSG